MKLNPIKFLPVLLLAACTTTKQPQQPAPEKLSAPAAVALEATVIDNCAVGCPTGGSFQTLIREAYTLNNNSSTKFANWVAYKITKTSQASGKDRNWKLDPSLPASDTLAPAAYNGANAALAVDRGHQAPLASLAGTSDWQSLNYLSNITPQKSALNQGAWARLEDQERVLANRSDVSAVYSVTGPLFEKNIATLPAVPSVQIPSGYWKIIFIGTSPDKGIYAAFLMNQDTPKNANFCNYQVTVDSIEAKTNPKLTVWSALPANVAAVVKSQKGTLAKEIGCP
ncbi:DNA/RNA non-specific endonuclease [Dickeya dadantii]|uniref:DNA/RNA non-specific endonuclease n=1 Tax=Dickeya dadantii TaxID=204038 RepID=UPI001C0C207A|nr:DNA/RNA non-specific endonuclease [Dickeya dadantii]QWT40136.1 DNA/RNA non-specific endonuclease [Dickeya dadantii]